MSDLPTLRAKVEAAQALAAKATLCTYDGEDAHGPNHHGACPECGRWVPTREPESGLHGARCTIMLRARAVLADREEFSNTAPDLVTLATDLLALVESQAAELTVLRGALSAWGRWAHSPDGMDGELFDAALEATPADCFPPNEDCDFMAGGTVDPAHCGHVMSQRAEAGCLIRTLCPLPAGHEGPHAEALGAGDGGGDGGGR